MRSHVPATGRGRSQETCLVGLSRGFSKRYWDRLNISSGCSRQLARYCYDHTAIHKSNSNIRHWQPLTLPLSTTRLFGPKFSISESISRRIRTHVSVSYELKEFGHFSIALSQLSVQSQTFSPLIFPLLLFLALWKLLAFLEAFPAIECTCMTNLLGNGMPHLRTMQRSCHKKRATWRHTFEWTFKWASRLSRVQQPARRARTYMGRSTQ